jgi:shikimate kinase
MDPRTRELIRSRAVSVWLRAELDVLVRRCSRRNTRPLLQSGDPSRDAGAARPRAYPVYAEADLTVETSESPHDAAVAAILDALSAGAGRPHEIGFRRTGRPHLSSAGRAPACWTKRARTSARC